MQNNIGQTSPVPVDSNAKPAEMLPQSMNSDVSL